MHWVVRIAVLAFVGGAVFGILLAEVLLRIRHTASGIRPQEYGLRSESVEVLAPDGVTLRGWWVPAESDKGTVVLCHGYGADKGDALVFAQFLHQAGFGVLAMDLRGHGESEGRTGSLGYHEVGDLRAAVEWLFAQGKVPEGRLGIYGYSMGAGIAILAAVAEPRIRAVVADSAFADGRETVTRWLRFSLPLPRFPVLWATIWWAERRLGCDYSAVSPERTIGRVSPRPVFLIHGELDEVLPVTNSRRLYAAAGEPKELWTVPKAGHVGALDEAGESYRTRVTGFLERALAEENL